MKLYFHKLGTPQSADALVYERKDNPKWTIGGGVSEDGKYLIISVGDGTTSRKARIAYQELSDPANKIVELIDNHENKFDFLGNDGGVFYFKSDYQAPKYQVIAIDTKNPDKKNWKTIIAEAKEPLDSVDLVGNCFIASYLKDAKTAVKVYAVDGTFVRDVALPGIGTASGFGGKRDQNETFYTFSSFATPTSVYRYDIPTGESKLIRQAQVKFDPSLYEVKQVFYTSKDGTKVPMVHRSQEGHHARWHQPDTSIRLRRV